MWLAGVDSWGAAGGAAAVSVALSMRASLAMAKAAWAISPHVITGMSSINLCTTRGSSLRLGGVHACGGARACAAALAAVESSSSPSAAALGAAAIEAAVEGAAPGVASAGAAGQCAPATPSLPAPGTAAATATECKRAGSLASARARSSVCEGPSSCTRAAHTESQADSQRARSRPERGSREARFLLRVLSVVRERALLRARALDGRRRRGRGVVCRGAGVGRAGSLMADGVFRSSCPSVGCSGWPGCGCNLPCCCRRCCFCLSAATPDSLPPTLLPPKRCPFSVRAPLPSRPLFLPGGMG